MDLTVEGAKVHLTMLGYDPVMCWRRGWDDLKFIGVRKGNKIVYVRYGGVMFSGEMLWSVYISHEIEWWRLTDESILKLAKAIDNTLIGW